MDKLLKKIIKEIPLETRIRTTNEIAFINLIVELGYRESKVWTDEEDELFNKICKLADEHTNNILQDIEEWKSDGQP